MRGKKILSGCLFLALTVLTFYVILKDQNPRDLIQDIKHIHKGYLMLALFLSLFFVTAEGILIWYLLKAIGDKGKLASCIKYSFTGFFYSGITPSATGGQPMQLYYMRKDGRNIANSTVVLMSVAVAYKLVLVILGIGISIFWWDNLKIFMGAFLPLYFVGLFLNAILVVVLLAIMLNGPGMEKLICFLERFLIKIHVMKPSERRKEIIHSLVEQYGETVHFLKAHKKAIFFLVGFTFIQRCSLFVLTYFIYCGMGLQGVNPFTVIVLQAVIYIAVDMLPLPGSQGISEVIYATVFKSIFTGSSLTVSMCVSRGINFYFLFIISAIVAVYCWCQKGKI